MGALLPGCTGSPRIDPEGAPERSAAALVNGQGPEAAAVEVVGWLQSADTSRREFAKGMVERVLFFYDSIGATDSAARFVSSFDNLSASLSLDGRAHLLLMLNTPGKAGAILARNPQREPLAMKVDSVLASNPAALEAYRQSYEKYKSQYNKLLHENNSTIRRDNQ